MPTLNATLVCDVCVSARAAVCGAADAQHHAARRADGDEHVGDEVISQNTYRFCVVIVRYVLFGNHMWMR